MNKSKKADNDQQAYFIVGSIFALVGVIFFINESTRMVALPFFVIGMVFLVVGFSGARKKNKK